MTLLKNSSKFTVFLPAKLNKQVIK